MVKDIYDRNIIKDDKEERGFGKIAVLGLGYQMGAPKFVSTCASYGIDISEDFARAVVEAYRSKFYLVKELWYAQETAAIECVNVGPDIQCGAVTWELRKPFLYCRLPSARRLAYPFPEVAPKMMPWGEERLGLTYMGVDAYSHKWKRQHTYGGMLVENITQAVARDVMAEAMLRCNANGYPVVLSVHDEIVSDTLTGDVHKFEQLVTTLPGWAFGLPIAADAWTGHRYHK